MHPVNISRPSTQIHCVWLQVKSTVANAACVRTRWLEFVEVFLEAGLNGNVYQCVITQRLACALSQPAVALQIRRLCGLF